MIQTRVILIVAIGALCILLSGCGGSSAPPAAVGSAAGYVWLPLDGGPPIVSAHADAQAGYEPLDGGAVSVVGSSATLSTSCADGYYMLRDIPEGDWTLRIEAPGRAPREYPINIVAGMTRWGAG